MSIPDTPYTRKEAYLNAITTGDSSGIPETPYTREEMYLDAIAKGGGGGGGGGSTTLSGLTDVDISNPTDGQTLVYNATSGKWENASRRVLRIGTVYDEVTDTLTLTETWQSIYDALMAGVLVYLTDHYDEQGFVRSAYSSLVKEASYDYQANTYKITTDGLSGEQLAIYEYEAASANDYPAL